MERDPVSVTKGHELDRVVEWLRRLQQAGFFGTISLGLQNGQISTVEARAVVKPGERLPEMLRSR